MIQPPPRPAKPPRSTVVLAAIVLGVGTALSIAAYLYNRALERNRIEAEFARRVDIRHALTREIVNYYAAGLYALRALFAGSDDVSRQEFHQVATDVLQRYPGIAVLEWAPLVPASERAAFEAAVSRELGRPFQFTEPGPDGAMIRARDRAQHSPLLFIEPLAGNERAFGFDIQNAPSQPFLTAACATHHMVVSAQFDLVQGRRGVVMIWPVFSPLPGRTEPVCRGFVQGVFHLDEMFDQTQQRTPGTALDTLYLDASAENPAFRLLHYRAGDPSGGPAHLPSESEFRAGLHREQTIDVGGRHWLVLYRPTKAWLAEIRSWQPESALAAGLTITVLIAGLVSALARRTAAIQRLVTERTAELSESRRQLDALVQSLPGMAYRCRYDAALTVLYVSDGARTLTGYDPDDFITGRVQYRTIIHPGDLAAVRQATLRALRVERRPFEVEYRTLTRDGAEKWVLSRGRGFYDAAGELLFFEGLAIDVTARKQAEAEKLAIERKLLETQKLESLGLLAGGIAHDFNNLLTGIVGHAILAREDPDCHEPVLVTEHLQKIEAGAGRAAELCQQMLAYSGRGRFLVEPVDLTQLVRETLPLLQGSLPSRARLELELSPQPTAVMADATQMRQIAMNLILNAGDALDPAGGTIAIATGHRTFDRSFLDAARVGDTLPAGDYVFLEVRDTGCGMSPETLAKIFDPFFTTKFTGRGLGLAAVLGIVRGHHGALRVQSQPGRGSAFTLLLPPTANPLSLPPAPPTTERWQHSGHVLVIDDEPPVRDIAAQLLATFGFKVSTAEGGREGLALLRADPAAVDLVFLDLTMPGFSGEETLAELRTFAPRARVLLVSGYSETDHIRQLADHGPLVFMQKPFTRDKLERKLREIFA